MSEKPNIVLVITGGRNFRDEQRVFQALDNLSAEKHIVAMFHGAARGADTLAHRWAVAREVKSCPIPAWWDELGRSAGPMRNELMAQLAIQASEHRSREIVLVAFPGECGTTGMTNIAIGHRFSVVRG